MHKLSQGLFLLGLSALTAALSVMSCGSGGGGSANAAASSGGGAVLHVSGVGPAVVVPPSTIQVLRTIQWAAEPDEVPLQYVVDGTFTTTGSGSAQMTLRLYDPTGAIQLTGAGPVYLGGPATARPFSIIMGAGGINSFGIEWTHPPAGYRFTIDILTPASGSWTVEALTLKVVTVRAQALRPSPFLVDM